MTDRTGQSAIQAVSVAGNRELSPVFNPTPAVKYNPGWGVCDQGPYDGIETTMKSNHVSRIIETGAMSNVKHFMVAFTWGALQSGPGVYTFNILDDLLELCQQNGKRLVIIVQWSVQSSGTVAFQISQGRFPAYLDTTLHGVFAAPSSSRCSAAMNRPEIMTEYIALMQAISDRYNSHPWFEGVSTYDSAQAMTSTVPGFTVAAYRDQVIRLAEAVPGIFPNTAFFLSLDSGMAGAANMQQVVQAAADNRCILSCIDFVIVDHTQWFTNSLIGGELAQRIYQGIEGTKDFRSELGYGGRMANGNLGGTNLPSAAQYAPADVIDTLLLQILRNNFHSHYHFLPYKTIGFQTTALALANNQFWNVASTPPPTYTLYHPTLKEFLNLSAGTIALNTAMPANYTNVITGGT